MPRVVVIGAPRTGKTTYATKLARELGVHLASTGKHTEQPEGLVSAKNYGKISTDDYLNKYSYAELPSQVIADLRKMDSFVLEGTQAARVLRRWLRETPDEPRVDKALVFLGRPWVARTPKQEATAKGVRTTWRELEPMLQSAGIPYEHMTPPEMTESDWREHRSAELARAADADLLASRAPVELGADDLGQADAPVDGTGSVGVDAPPNGDAPIAANE